MLSVRYSHLIKNNWAMQTIWTMISMIFGDEEIYADNQTVLLLTTIVKLYRPNKKVRQGVRVTRFRSVDFTIKYCPISSNKVSW